MSGPAATTIRFEDVEHRFGARTVLRDVDLSLGERRVGVIGANGSGKSTLARMVNGLVVPSRGRVLVDGLDTRRDGPAVRRRVGFVFQNPETQIVLPTVAEDVGFGLRNRGLDDAEIERRVDAALERYGLAHLRAQPAHLLSGGEQQLLALCAVLVCEPARLVLDEPTTLLDHRNTRRFAEILRALDQRVLLVTHDLDLVGDCERVLVVDEGRVVADDEPAAAVARYLRLVSA